ncbi:4-hydroxy-3-methylbut-2-enyl diphosphate reductase [Desulfacinum hydrothermale DSM 13146]|uniref:4-hydroxy-3-methylbut-2-enyl diphosphate reductase n=1 Tax=Desulfacinum hydrothermale DSM 13146 TaxID=1121390 RepID=A0A1W1XM23_9BACT|nr:4-hydroxy-3-methylbut-2-enyl diphosphate reductase [Desulfacinum hydrothermale]SMC25029.1 4-hydroxy-3-methylbut-2-enyl diphosphate reductase [Desulfacinum hydrothermale DSM 13146]
MKVLVAETAGFCRGVRTALEMTLEATRSKPGEPLRTFGPLIHNRQVLAMLEQRGVTEARDLEECRDQWVIVRAHGIPPDQRRRLKQIGRGLIDATCKRVARVQAIIRKHARKGYHIVIAGDEDHAEVIGLMGYAEGRGTVIRKPEQVDTLPAWDQVLLVAQTTQNEEVFQAIVDRFRKKFPHGIVENTICNATHDRQREVRELCRQVDAMVIVGGYHSGNTVRLAEVARECGVPTYHVETEKDLDPGRMARYATVGVSAGASTPNWMIRNVVRFLEGIEWELEDKGTGWKRLLEMLAYNNLGCSLAAGLLVAAVSALTGLPIQLPHMIMAAAYAFSMHTLNRYLDHEALKLNDPERAAFYQRWRKVFTTASILSALSALLLAAGQGPWSAIVLLLLLAFGSLYAVPIFERRFFTQRNILTIKDIPGSKTFMVPLAWACVTVWVPHLHHLTDGFGRLLWAFPLVFLLVLLRTALLDCLDIQGDRLVGRETIVVLLGEHKTMRLLLTAAVALAVLLVAGLRLGLTTSFALFWLPAAAAYGVFAKVSRGKRLKDAPVLETMIELVIVALGVLGAFWLWMESF